MSYESIFDTQAIQEQIDKLEQELKKAFEAGWNAHIYATASVKRHTSGPPRTEVEVAIDSNIRNPDTLSFIYLKQKKQV
jgi:hypothetical protein